MPVLKFPGVGKTKDDLTPEELKEQVHLILGDLLTPRTEEEEARRQDELWEELYYENATDAVRNFRGLMVEWERATKTAHGEDSVEFRVLKDQTTAVRKKLDQIDCNLDDPAVKAVIKPLHAIWAEYRGWYQNDNGERQQRKKPVGPEILSAFDRTIACNLR